MKLLFFICNATEVGSQVLYHTDSDDDIGEIYVFKISPQRSSLRIYMYMNF